MDATTFNPHGGRGAALPDRVPARLGLPIDAGLVAVMIMVSIGTFSWRSIANLRTHPLSTSVVMLATVAVVVATHNLAFGVLTGVLIASLNFATKVSRFMRVTSVLEGTSRTYTVTGQVFFASADRFTDQTILISVKRLRMW